MKSDIFSGITFEAIWRSMFLAVCFVAFSAVINTHLSLAGWAEFTGCSLIVFYFWFCIILLIFRSGKTVKKLPLILNLASQATSV